MYNWEIHLRPDQEKYMPPLRTEQSTTIDPCLRQLVRPFYVQVQTPPHVLNIPQQFLCVSLTLISRKPCEISFSTPRLFIYSFFICLLFNDLCDFPIPLHSPLYLLGAEVAQEEMG